MSYLCRRIANYCNYMIRKTCLILIILLLPFGAHAQVVWFDGEHPITYSMPKQVEPVVQVALDMWKDDMQQVTGLTPMASAKPAVKVVQGRGVADGFRIYVKDGQIVVEGNNGRGMAYGLTA